ncbi:hypothetical protein [Loigolactobacillus iwatensis]|nr:hypothetical protein [Loigolactobacillus iwatensis]
MVELYKSNHILAPIPNLNLSVSANILGSTQFDFNHLGIFSPLIFIFQFIYVLINWKASSLVQRTVTTVGFFYLILSSNLIPWTVIGNHVAFMQSFQEPQRFTVVADILLLIGFGMTLTELKISQQKLTILKSLVFTLAISMSFYTNESINEASNLWQNNQLGYLHAVQKRTNNLQIIRNSFFRQNDLGTGLRLLVKPTPDYLPTNKKVVASNYSELNPYKLYSEQVLNNNLPVQKSISGNNTLVLKWVNDSNKSKSTQIPVFHYAQTQLVFNHNNLHNKEFKISKLGAVILNSRPGVNLLKVKFVPSKFFGILWLITLISWLFAFVYSGIRFIHKLRVDS